jgi:hypothetical protein
MANNPFIETGQGVFIPTAEVVNIAGRLTARETAIHYAVDDWLIVEGTSAPIGQASKAYYPVPNRPPSTIIRCRLRNDDRRLHALRAESDALVHADLQLDIQATQDGTSCGSVTHHPPAALLGDDGSGERLCGRLLIAQDRFQFIVDRLKQPRACLTVMVKLPLYKSVLAHEVDTDATRQDLYLRYGETVPITGYSLEVVTAPERVATDKALETGDLPPPKQAADGAPPLAGATESRPFPRLTEWLLGTIALILLISVLAGLAGG